MSKDLTAVAVKKIKPGKTRLEIPDRASPGLFLIVQPSGKRSFALRFRRPDGRSAKLTLGPADFSARESSDDPALGQPLTLAAARQLAAQVQRDRVKGKDVVAEYASAKRRQKFEGKVRAANTFANAARDFIQQYGMKKLRGWRASARQLGLRPDDRNQLHEIKGGLAERWADKAVAEVTSSDIRALVLEVRRHGIPGLGTRIDQPTEARARALLSTLSRMFRWLIQYDQRVESNPCRDVARPDAPKPRERVLTDDEVVAFWKAAGEERIEFSALLRLLLVTGVRLNEACGMVRSELSKDGTTWSLPGSRTKNGRPLELGLPPLGQELIKSVGGDGELIFSTTGHSKISGWSKIQGRLRKRMKVSNWHLHDLRRTAATGMAGLGIEPHVVEAVLNHVSGFRAGVAGTYNRHSYAAEKKNALARWAAHIQDLIENRKSKVVPFGKRGKK